jgi:dihydrofolate reductase
MSRTNLSMSASADGYVAGPEQSVDEPLGVGGRAVHDWHLGPAKDHPVNKQVIADMMADMGATIMGRNMFGPERGEWAGSRWTGWWGDEPPYHCPVFVLTHYARDPIEMAGGTTFYFVTTGIESAHAQARAMAGDRPISIAGARPVAVRQFKLGWSTRSICRSARCSSDPVSVYSMVSRPVHRDWNSSGCSKPPAWHTSATASSTS